MKVRIYNLDTGAAIDGALFRAETRGGREQIVLSSDAAQGLEMDAEERANLRIVALRPDGAGSGKASATVAKSVDAAENPEPSSNVATPDKATPVPAPRRAAAVPPDGPSPVTANPKRAALPGGEFKFEAEAAPGKLATSGFFQNDTSGAEKPGRAPLKAPAATARPVVAVEPVKPTKADRALLDKLFADVAPDRAVPEPTSAEAKPADEMPPAKATPEAPVKLDRAVAASSAPKETALDFKDDGKLVAATSDSAELAPRKRTAAIREDDKTFKLKPKTPSGPKSPTTPAAKAPGKADRTAAAPKGTTDSGLDNGRYLQVGLFSVAKNASTLVARLRAEKLPAAITPAGTAERPLHRVVAGPFATTNDMVAARDRLGRMGLKDTVPVTK